MSFIISSEMALLLLVIFAVYIFYRNWDILSCYNSIISRLLFSAVILSEIGIIVGSRFFIPNLLKKMINQNSTIYFILDVGLFLAILFGVFKIGSIVKEKIK